MKLGTMFTFF